MTTITFDNGNAVVKRMPTGAWQVSKGVSYADANANVKRLPTGLVKSPNYGVRRDSMKTAGDMLVRPYDYKGRR